MVFLSLPNNCESGKWYNYPCNGDGTSVANKWEAAKNLWLSLSDSQDVHGSANGRDGLSREIVAVTRSIVRGSRQIPSDSEWCL